MIINLLGVIAATVAIYKYEKKWINEGLDYTLNRRIFDVLIAMMSWVGFFAVFFALCGDCVIIKGKNKFEKK